jgi:hypothetical protein
MAWTVSLSGLFVTVVVGTVDRLSGRRGTAIVKAAPTPTMAITMAAMRVRRRFFNSLS